VLVEESPEAGIELGDRQSVLERERRGLAAIGPENELVLEEIEAEIERRCPEPHLACGQAADVDVERHVPPVVARMRRGETNLVDELDVEMERLLRRRPVGIRDVRRLSLLGHERDLVDVAAAPLFPPLGRSG